MARTLQNKLRAKVTKQMAEIEKDEEQLTPEEENAIMQEKLEEINKKAHGGCPESMNALGDALRKGGLGLTEDVHGAVQWYKQAAMKNDKDAQFNLALCYFTGTGVEIDDQLCAALLHRAAEAGQAKACAHLAQNYLLGQAGVDKDTKKGLKWMDIGAKAGDRTCNLNLGNIFYHGKYDVTANRGVALQYFIGAAQKEEPLACRMLAIMAEKGQGRQANIKDAATWFLVASNAGDAISQYRLAQILQNGYPQQGVMADPDQALHWLELAAKQRLTPAVEALRELQAEEDEKSGMKPLPDGMEPPMGDQQGLPIDLDLPLEGASKKIKKVRSTLDEEPASPFRTVS